MQKDRSRKTVAVIAGLAIALCTGGAPGPKAKDRYQAMLIVEGDGMEMVQMEVVTVSVQNWTTDAEAQTLRAALAAGGQDGLNKAMSKYNLGFIALQGSFGWPVNVARAYPQPNGGQRIIVGTTRPIGFAEGMVEGASLNYPFGMIQLDLDANGRGTGAIIGAASVSIDSNGKLDVNPYSGLSTKLSDARKLK
jgi:hypothetical protein